MTNYTLVDIFGILRVLPFFALIFLAPGYCLGRVSNVLRFRQRGAAEQWLLSMGISIVVMPITLNLLSRWFSLRCHSLAMLASRRHRRRRSARTLASQQILHRLLRASLHRDRDRPRDPLGCHLSGISSRPPTWSAPLLHRGRRGPRRSQRLRRIGHARWRTASEPVFLSRLYRQAALLLLLVRHDRHSRSGCRGTAQSRALRQFHMERLASRSSRRALPEALLRRPPSYPRRQRRQPWRCLASPASMSSTC